MRSHPKIVLVLAVLLLSGCASWSTSNTKTYDEGKASTHAATNPAQITVTDKDITDRPYTVLGDITANVNKTTIFHDDPTRDMVNEKLRKEAAELGADAVILVRYGDGGVSMMSWGSMEGKGRAVKFK